MGQVNSTEASSSSSIFTVEELRKLANRIMVCSSEKLRDLRESVAGIDASSIPSTNNVKTPLTPEEVQDAAVASVASLTDGLGFAADSSPNDGTVFRFRGNSPAEIKEMVKVNYELSVDWVKKNPGSAFLALLAFGATVAVGTVAYHALKLFLRYRRQFLVLKGQNNSKREVVVITDVETIEGTAMALTLDKQFLVFVGVPNQARADYVQTWGSREIRPVIVDYTKENPFEDLVRTVTNFLDQKNGALLGVNISPPSSSSSIPYEEDISSSTSNIRITGSEKPISELEAKQSRLGKNTTPFFRLSAVIVNPSLSTIGTIENVDLSLWRQTINANITGTVVAVQKFLPLIRRTLALTKLRRSPRVIIVSSAVTGNISYPYQSALCASQHAIESISDSLRREVKYMGVDVVCLRHGVSDRSYVHGAKGSIRGYGLFDHVNPTQILRSAFKSHTTTEALCDATFAAITSRWPSKNVKMGKHNMSYSFVATVVPRFIVDWSLKRVTSKATRRLSTKVASASSSKDISLPREE
ncbi:hypothetical protein BGZ49_005818 [Haplosporangium sp. Z 27]|nr:hypothetical protein BGZ49_005818 [Haplosporangium sp. Z 27]